MALDAVVLGKQFWQCGDAYDYKTAEANQSGELTHCGLIIVEVLDHVEGEKAVAGCDAAGQRFGDIGFDQLAIRLVNEFENAPGDIETGGVVPGGFERLQVYSPTAAD